MKKRLKHILVLSLIGFSLIATVRWIRSYDKSNIDQSEVLKHGSRRMPFLPVNIDANHDPNVLIQVNHPSDERSVTIPDTSGYLLFYFRQ